ncbi:MAG: hypothetical protein CMJ18_16955 [Phycisphaeraceae bacterium]|nr:hypothetical protein [Phycisphaeraceae bacterium]
MTVISPGGAHAALLQATARYTMVNPFDVNTGGTDESLIGGDSFGHAEIIPGNFSNDTFARISSSEITLGPGTLSASDVLTAERDPGTLFVRLRMVGDFPDLLRYWLIDKETDDDGDGAAIRIRTDPIVSVGHLDTIGADPNPMDLWQESVPAPGFEWDPADAGSPWPSVNFDVEGHRWYDIWARFAPGPIPGVTDIDGFDGDLYGLTVYDTATQTLLGQTLWEDFFFGSNTMDEWSFFYHGTPSTGGIPIRIGWRGGTGTGGGTFDPDLDIEQVAFWSGRYLTDEEIAAISAPEPTSMAVLALTIALTANLRSPRSPRHRIA